MANCDCCDLVGGWTSFPQPDNGYVLSGLCEKTTIKYLPIKAGQEFDCHQAVFYAADGKLTTVDTDPTAFAGIMVHGVDATQPLFEQAPPVYVSGSFDAEQTVFATLTWDDPDLAQAMRRVGMFLIKRS